MSYIGNTPISAAFLTDTFSGNGSTTAFTMTVAPANTSSILVVITGVTQDPSTYSVSGTTLTFSAAPPSGTNNISVRYLGIPASGVTTTAYRTVTEFTATAGQTSFSVPSYTVGYIDVYRNGARLGAADYTATTGTTVVLASGATVGDLVTTESFYVSSVLNAIPATAGSVGSTYLASSLALTSPTLTSPTISGTPVMASSILTSGTAVATTSGTSVDITGIPSWVKRVTVMFNGVSTTSGTNYQVQLGAGSIVSTGYVGNYTVFYGGTSLQSNNLTTGFGINNSAGTGDTVYGSLILTLFGSNTWVGTGSTANNTRLTCFAGGVTLSGALDRIRLTTLTAVDTFDAGSINILYE